VSRRLTARSPPQPEAEGFGARRRSVDHPMTRTSARTDRPPDRAAANRSEPRSIPWRRQLLSTNLHCPTTNPPIARRSADRSRGSGRSEPPTEVVRAHRLGRSPPPRDRSDRYDRGRRAPIVRRGDRLTIRSQTRRTLDPEPIAPQLGQRPIGTTNPTRAQARSQSLARAHTPDGSGRPRGPDRSLTSSGSERSPPRTRRPWKLSAARATPTLHSQDTNPSDCRLRRSHAPVIGGGQHRSVDHAMRPTLGPPQSLTGSGTDPIGATNPTGTRAGSHDRRERSERPDPATNRCWPAGRSREPG
jgi:hypothetical protein